MAFWKISSSNVDGLSSIAFTDVTGSLPFERLSGKRVLQKIVTGDNDIPYNSTEIPDFRKRILPATSGMVYLSASVDFSHRGISAGSLFTPEAGYPPYMGAGSYYAIGIGIVGYYRSGATVSAINAAGFTNVPNATGAGQIESRAHHYTTCHFIRVPFQVTGGTYYDFSIAATAHTDAGSMNGVDGAAELTTGGGTNRLIIEYEPGVLTIE